MGKKIVKGIESKNVKRFYVPKTMVIYFTESKINIFDEMSKLVAEYTKFVQIGSKEDEYQSPIASRFTTSFYSWNNIKDGENHIISPSSFFGKKEIKNLINELKKIDFVIIVYKSNQINSLSYVKELVDLFQRNDVFAFHYVIENFISEEKTERTYKKLVSNFIKKRQIYVPIKEESILNAYKDATIATRNHYTKLYVNDLIESFISPFLDPIKNPDHFPRVKALFYQSEKNFESKVLTTLGYSSEKNDFIDLALIQALSNPIFCGAFDASNTFVVNVKVPFLTNDMLERINYVLKSVVGEWKQFLISSYVGSFDFEVYCQISIMAINVDDSKLITDKKQIESHVKKIIEQVSSSKQLFDDKTKTMILEKEIDTL